jgi:hypothetical protein
MQDCQHLSTNAVGEMGYRFPLHHYHYTGMVHESVPTKPYVLFPPSSGSSAEYSTH